MRKIVLILSLSVLILSGCSFSSKKQDIPPPEANETKLDRFIGVVQSAREINEQNALTGFFLLTETGQKFYLDSLTVNLRRYQKRKVEVEGKWNDERTVFLVDNVISLLQEAQIKQIYINSRMGLKFSYPSVWELVEEENASGKSRLIITPYKVTADESTNTDTLIIERTENNRKLTPREFLGLDEEYRLPDTAQTGITYQQSAIGTALLDTVKKTEGQKIEFFVSRDTFLYIFSHTTAGDADKDMYRNAFYDLVQGFEFVPFDDTLAPVTIPPVQAVPESSSATVSPPESSAPPPASPTAVTGMKELELKVFKIKIQYPKNWWWAYRDSGYSFSDKSVEDDNVLLHFQKNPEKVRPNTDEAVTPCNKLKANYCITGHPQYKDVMLQMLKSIVEV